MNRYKSLEKEINKNIEIDEKSNIVIEGWSPNNVRRLIIGFEFAIVQYHRTGGKYKRLIEIVDMRTSARKDLTEEKRKSILEVLITGRICSSVEEIVFCLTDEYPRDIFSIDIDLSVLARGNISLENRFVRLRHISVVPITLQQVSELVAVTKDSDQLLIDKINERGIRCNVLVEQHKDDWWRGTSLRPKYYTMDKKELQEHFGKIIEIREQKIKEDKYKEVDRQRNEHLIKKLEQNIGLVGVLFDLHKHMNSVFESIPVLSKAEWGFVLQDKMIFNEIRKEFKRRDGSKERSVFTTKDGLINGIRRIDFDKIKEYTNEENISSIENIEKFIFEGILTDTESYKREKNKYSLSESIDNLIKTLLILLDYHIKIVFLSLIRNLTRNSPNHANFYYDRIKILGTIKYTRSMIEYCNRRIDYGWAKEAMVNIDSQELSVDNFSVSSQINQSKQILDAMLKGVRGVVKQ